MVEVPTDSVAAQTLTISLSNQTCQINLSQRTTGLYCDLYVNNSLIIGGVICENLNRIVRSAYLGFSGDFMFLDTQGETDPYYTGLGTRYLLIYLEPSEIQGA
ncbi:MAG: hypothetical protein GC190_19335 [Alphaproteobacteria bacterium]|nr:hypothetical protein [Alphaproteobacteria bacterium]